MNSSTTLLPRGRAGARKAADSQVVEAAARWGLAARGVIYGLVGVIALRIALDGTREQADRGGALSELADRPFGSVLLWAVGVGLAGMALWRLTEALFGASGPDGRKTSKRLLSGARALFYGFIAASVLAMASGSSSSASGSGDQQSRDVTARALELPAGQWIVGAAGVVAVGAGLWMAGRAVTRRYRKHLRGGQMPRWAWRVTNVCGVGGGVARGIVFAAVGAFVVRAAAEARPGKAKGFDDTLRSFATTQAGPWLLVAVAVGLVLFGLFSFAMARWRRV
ncbi:DUF1206 domain-containing protein [Streptomyces flavalbus]|uniref:DUF1206 domain-containing protein n=1 Tax=Streptomyces flavalbus TaxID=2665155 RepID=A0ABW2W0M3_9ACTN